jgi:hypothetical protein
MAWKAVMMPATVPSSPTKGAVEPMVASEPSPRRRSVMVRSVLPVDGPVHRGHHVEVADLAGAAGEARRLQSAAVLLQRKAEHLGQVALLVLLGVGGSTASANFPAGSSEARLRRRTGGRRRRRARRSRCAPPPPPATTRS